MARVTAAPVPTEHEEQVLLFRWAELHLWHEPRLGLLFAVPNGGARHPRVGAKLRAEGVRRGVPDTCLPVPSGDWHALFIEMKRRKGGAVSPEQRKMIELLRTYGNRVEVAKGWEEAAAVLCEYLGRPDMLPSLEWGSEAWGGR